MATLKTSSRYLSPHRISNTNTIWIDRGTYLKSTPIEAYYYTRLVGVANDLPIIKTSASFIGLGEIETDVYEANDNGGEWYINVILSCLLFCRILLRRTSRSKTISTDKFTTVSLAHPQNFFLGSFQSL